VTAKSFIPILTLVLLCGCFKYPSDRLVSLSDFQDTLPKNNIEALSKMKRLTLTDARKFALAGNPDYRSAQHAVSVAKYRYYRSLSAYLPEVNFHASAGQSIRNSHDLLNPPAGIMPWENRFSSQLGLTASLLVFDGLEREFTMLAARQERCRSQALDRNAKRLLLRAVAFAYYDAVLALEQERIAAADLSFQKSSLAQAENQYRNGLVSKAAVLNFRILANAARSAILNARYRHTAARNSLASLMGFSREDLPPQLELDCRLPDDRELIPSLEFCLEQAAANRPDLRAAVLLLDIASFRKWSAYSGFLPVIRAGAGLDFTAETARYGGYSVDRSHHNTTDFSYGVSGEWNLFKGFSTFNLVREQTVRQELARFHMEDVFLKAVTEVKDAYANYLNARGQVRIYRETVGWVFEQRALVQSEFWCGRETITRLNGAQSDLVEAESRLAIARIELLKAIIQLSAAAAMPESGEVW